MDLTLPSLFRLVTPLEKLHLIDPIVTKCYTGPVLSMVNMWQSIKLRDGFLFGKSNDFSPDKEKKKNNTTLIH